MLRAVSAICVDSQILLFGAAKRDVYRWLHTSKLLSSTTANQTVLSTETPHNDSAKSTQSASFPPPQPESSSSSGSTPPPKSRHAWTIAAALAITASLGGVYFYKKINDESKKPASDDIEEDKTLLPKKRPIPPTGENIPRHIQYLLVGAGTASFAAMRAIRSQRPEAQVLMVGSEYHLPYMRPPLSKELWRESNLHAVEDLDTLTFKQWNGRTRSVSYEPSVFYTPVEALGESGGTAVLRGWTVTRIDVENHQADLVAPGCDPVTVTYDKCLVATGSRPRRLSALRSAARAGRALVLRSVQDVQRLAAALQQDGTRRVCVLGAGFLATELSAALADRLKDTDKTVIQMYREKVPLESVMPEYLADEAARSLRALGVSLISDAEVAEAKVVDEKVEMRLQNGETVLADLVVECVGSELDTDLAGASKLELHPDLGGLMVNAELQARTDVYAAGDAACFYDVVLGRRRLEHHDHAVVSGRLAGENMALAPGAPARHYTHQSMFWSDLGPELGYEAIGIIDSKLQTLGVFCENAVRDLGAGAARRQAVGAGRSVVATQTPAQGELAAPDSMTEESSGVSAKTVKSGVSAETVKSGVSEETAKSGDARSLAYDYGVVFYLREKRVVGVLLWNLFNRMHIARQVLAQGEFEDLFEVAKLFSLHEDD